MQKSKKLTLKNLSLKALNLNILVLSCSVLTLGFNNSSNAATTKKDLKKVASKISYLSCAVLNGYATKVKEYIDSGADITEVNKTETADTTLIYDALFIKNEAVRNKIVNMLLTEIVKDRYKDVKEEHLERKNYRKASDKINADQKPATVLEKSFDLGYLDISEKLIEIGAKPSDDSDVELHFFYGKILLDIMKNKAAK